MFKKAEAAILIFAALVFTSANAQKTVGTLLNESGAFGGYTLFTPMHYTCNYLINAEGRLINSWPHPNGDRVNHGMLLKNGQLLRGVWLANSTFSGMPALHATLEMVDWDGKVTWEYTLSTDQYIMHNDFIPIYQSDGSFHILATVYERVDNADAVAAGRDPSCVSTKGFIALDKLVEIKPDLTSGGGTIVWEWRAFDHLVQQDYSDKENHIANGVKSNPQLLHFNYFKNPNQGKSADWMHVNGLSYHAEYDQIVIGHHGANQLIIIDHSTTTAEAASHSGGNSGKGGDILYRWGNPKSYDATEVQVFQGLHDPHWIPEGLTDAGKIMIFDNGYNSQVSSIQVITPPETSPGVYTVPSAGSPFGPTSEDWKYSDGNNFWSRNMGNAHRLANGNTLINEAVKGRFFEIDANGKTVWNYISPVISTGAMEYDIDSIPVSPYNGIDLDNEVFKIFRYTADYEGLTGKDLTPGNYIEIYPNSIQLSENDLQNNLHLEMKMSESRVMINYVLLEYSDVQIALNNSIGKKVAVLANEFQNAGNRSLVWNGKSNNGAQLTSGVYLLQINAGNVSATRTFYLR